MENADPLGERIKNNFENRTRYYVPRRTYTIIRLDGCHFKTYTRKLKRPFDRDLYQDIETAIKNIMPLIQGSVLAYAQSDEISILLCDFATPNTDAWFDGNIQKICSVSASTLTAEFNKLRIERTIKNTACESFDAVTSLLDIPLATFDARVFSIPDRTEVMNYFRWRQQDWIRNSVSMIAQTLYSHKELYKKSTSDKHEMLHQKGVNWADDFIDREKNGLFVFKAKDFIQSSNDTTQYIEQSRWVAMGAWKFTGDDGQLLGEIPTYEM